MVNGYMGKMLFIDLSTCEIEEEPVDEKLCRDFLGGYGIASRIIYSRQKAGADPLGPDSIFGFVTGPLTGTPMPFGSRYTAVGKSPLTETWGDANSGGFFGPHLKFSGYDAVFFSGISPSPVYLLINDGKPELKDARHIWGRDTNETEYLIRSEIGEKARVAAIGRAGENLSLISCVINDRGRAAARSGLGAVMGSKRLKAVAVVGNKDVPIADRENADRIAREYRQKMTGIVYEVFKEMGTSAGLSVCVLTGDSPVKNWGGVGIRDFPNASAISDQKVQELVASKYGCWGCPLGCGATMQAGNEYSYEAGVHRPEYETLSAFGPLCMNDNLESILKATDICNREGLDTISAGAAISFAIECFENGLIAQSDTDGLSLTWGNQQAIVAMTEMIVTRQGFGDILADGVMRAAEQIGKGSEQYAFHVGGQELPMHDPRLAPSFGGVYQSDPTPGRHTQGELGRIELGIEAPEWLPVLDKYTYTGKGAIEARMKNALHTLNASGMCSFATMVIPEDAPVTFIAAVSGWEFNEEAALRIGERIANMRQAFNIREGVTAESFRIRGRPVGNPPLDEGPTANVVVDADTLRAEYFRAMDWDPVTGKPSRQKLEELGLYDVASDLWK